MGTALEKYQKRMATAADDYASEEKTGGSFITTRGGILKYGEEELPGNEMLVVILDAIHENTYYPAKFDPDLMLPPKCFAFGRSDKEMEPHDNVPDPDDEDAGDSYFEIQADPDADGDYYCDNCPFSEWGSADTGKGKACTNRRRLAVIPAGRFVSAGGKRKSETKMEVFEEADHYRDADLAFLKLPVTSTKAWSKYVHSLRKEHSAPPFAVLTHVYIEPHEKNQFEFFFDFIEVVEDPDILEILFARNEEAKEAIEQAYEEPSDEDLEQPKAKAKQGLGGLRKNRGKK